MILQEQKDIEVLSDGEQQESIAMSLDSDSTQMLMQMLSKNLYSDEIGSTVRELASNALDSHRRAGVTDKPIIVSLQATRSYDYEFAVEDFGVGLDDDDVRNIISKYGKSLSRVEANSLGMFGLGFKSPLAYTSAFYFIARKNGMERKYMMYEGESGNAIDLLNEVTTEEGNGVKVIVPLKYNDQYNFVLKIKEQLAYFEDVYFNVYSGVSNSFTIFRGDEYQYSENNTDQYLHICLDNVYYPIDFNKLNIARISVPIGLRFTLSDGLFPTPNRESLRYTAEAKEVILKKIKTVADYFITKFNESITELTDIEDVFAFYNNKRRDVQIAEDIGRTFDVSTFIPFSNIALESPKFQNVELLDLERLTENKNKLVGEYEIRYDLSRFKISELSKRKSKDISLNDVSNSSKHFYLYKDALTMLKKEYLKSTLSGYENCYLIKKTREYKLGYNTYVGMYEDTYYKLLKLKKYPKDQWRQIIKEYQYIQSLVTSKFTDVDKMEIAPNWLEARKKRRLSILAGGNRRVKLQGELSCKMGEPLERFMEGRFCKFVATTLKYERLHKIGALIVYDTHENNDNLNALYEITNHSKVKCMTLSDREIRTIEKLDIHNLISYKKFMEGDNKPFKRLVTAYAIKKLMDDYKGIFEKSFHLKTISTDLINKIQSLVDYKIKNYQYASNHELYETMLSVAESHNLFDLEIYSTYTEVRTFLGKLPFISILLEKMGRYENYVENKQMINILCDMLKYYKIRIDYTNYNIVLNDTTLMDEILTDETVEGLLEDNEEEEEVVEEIVDEV